MNCSEFLSGFSEYFDGTIQDRRRFDRHVESCERCREYERVVRRGIDLVKSLPEPELSEEFTPRLQHRIYHLNDREALARDAHGSGATTATVFAIAAILMAVAWAPPLRPSEILVELPPIVVDDAPQRPAPVSIPATTFFQPLPSFPPFDTDRFWEGSRSLLYQSSPLYERYRPPILVRTGLD